MRTENVFNVFYGIHTCIYAVLMVIQYIAVFFYANLRNESE